MILFNIRHIKLPASKRLLLAGACIVFLCFLLQSVSVSICRENDNMRENIQIFPKDWQYDKIHNEYFYKISSRYITNDSDILIVYSDNSKKMLETRMIHYEQKDGFWILGRGKLKIYCGASYLDKDITIDLLSITNSDN